MAVKTFYHSNTAICQPANFKLVSVKLKKVLVELDIQGDNFLSKLLDS